MDDKLIDKKHRLYESSIIIVWWWLDVEAVGDGVKMFVLCSLIQKVTFAQSSDTRCHHFVSTWKIFTFIYSKCFAFKSNSWWCKQIYVQIKDSSSQQQVDGIRWEKFFFCWHFKAWHHQQTHHPITNSDLIITLSSSPFANSNDDTM